MWIFRLVLGIVALGTAGAAAAQTQPKILTVDFQQAMLGSKAGQQLVAHFRKSPDEALEARLTKDISSAVSRAILAEMTARNADMVISETVVFNQRATLTITCAVIDRVDRDLPSIRIP